ncbi:MAG: glycosyltransferase [Candidatus Woesearchaeota archaeon]
MKIDVIGPTAPTRGGISHYTTLMCENIAKTHNLKCYSFKRLYPWFYPGASENDEESKVQIKTGADRFVDSANPYTWAKAFGRVKKDKPNLLVLPWWTTWMGPMFFSIAAMTKTFTNTKVMFQCHNVLSHERKFFDKFVTKNIFRLGDYFIVQSKEDRDKLLSLKKDAKVKIAVHPTYEVFNQKEWNKEDVKQELGLKGDVILFFGYVRPYKGLMYLVEAMPKILKQKDVTLLIVGEFWSPTKEEVVKRLEELGVMNKVIIVDKYIPNEEVGKYYSASDIVVLPYTSATNSGIVQTAFGLNIPVIVTNEGGLPEVVMDGKTGYIVPTESSDEIARAVVRFYNDRETIDFAKNIKDDKRRFEWDRLTETIESFM